MKPYKGEPSKFFGSYFDSIYKSIILEDTNLLLRAADLLRGVEKRGGKVIFIGNGGSAAMASHLSVDLTKAAKIRGINFNEADLLTCFANDFGYEHWAARALEAYADKSDVVVLISSSGRSLNIINGAVQARKMNLPIITFSGFSGNNPLRKLGDLNFWCDSEAYNIVEMTHHVWLLSIVDYIVHRNAIEGFT